jgi:hypothetical protein
MMNIKRFIASIAIIPFALILSASDSYGTGETRTFESLNSSSNLVSLPKSTLDADVTTVPDSIKTQIQKINALANQVTSENRLINVLDPSVIIEYPIGIVKSGGDLNYAIILNQDEITKTGSTLNAFMSFKIPQTGDSLAFSAKNISLSKNAGLVSDIKLELLTNQYFKLGDNITVKILGGTGQTYVIAGCDGFKSMSISAEIYFSNTVFLCENPATGAILPDKQLKTSFTATITDWNDLLVQLSLDPFQIKGIDGFGFEVKNLVLDFSDLNNATGMVFPKGYESSYFVDGNQNLWRGLYIQKATVRLPPQFKKKSGSTTSSARVAIDGTNLIIDNEGFSGKLEADNLLTLSEGDMGGGWSFSVDKFSLSVKANSLEAAGFSGKVKVPELDSTLIYSAIISMDGDFTFSATTTKKNSFNMWVATLDLYPNSTIEVKSVDGKFLPKAILNGKLSVSASLEDKPDKESDQSKNVSLADIEFQGLQLQTVSPRVTCCAFSLGSEKAQQAMASFPIQIKSIGGSIADTKASLTIDMTLNLTSAFSGEGGFTVIGEKSGSGDSATWKFKTIVVNNITINVATGPIKMNGTIIFFKQNATYGNGFQGSISAEFGSGIKAGATALFGKISSNRYWFADASVSFSSGLPLFTGIGAYGFGGGAYFHMKQASYTTSSTTSATTATTIGKSLSGIVYMPDSTTFLGVKASMKIGTYPKDEPFNGDVGFEIAFNSSYGVKFIQFSGNGYFMTPPIPVSMTSITEGCKKIAAGGKGDPSADQSSTRGSITASVLISYDFDNDVLHGDLKVYVNVGGLIKGVNANNLAGEAVLHFASDEWYIYIGTPSQPVGISIMGLYKTESYFMVGTKILDSPAPPAEVSSILGGIDLDYTKDLNELGAGSGIAFGSRLTVSTGDITFLLFYANLTAGMGFDVMLKNYGNATCSGSSDPLGINGWYANGQAYAYVEGKVGINVKLFMIKKKVEILSLGVAAILQAKLPNPMWMHGAVGGYFSVMGGVVKGNCKFEFTIGNDCKIEGGSALNNLDVISAVTPSVGATDVSVFTKPQAVFNYQVEKPFELVDLDDIKKTFRVKLDYFNVTDGSNTVDAKQEWNSDHTVLAMRPSDILPGQKKMTASIQVSFEEYKDNTWQAVYDQGVKIVETKTADFETGTAPDYIPTDNVSYSYPIINQVNYYKDESTVGYIKLLQGQDYLFDVTSEWTQQGRFTSVTTGTKLTFKFTYDRSGNEISFTRPDGLSNSEIYKFELVNVPATTTTSIDANVDSVVTKVSSGSDENDVSVKTQTAEGSISELKEKSIYTSYFRTSTYNSLSQKLSSSNNNKAWLWPIRTNVEVLYTTLNVTETFDNFEIHGLKEIPLIHASAVLNDNKWFNNIMNPIIYQDYPITPVLLISDTMGIPPVNAIYVYQSNDQKELTESEISNGAASQISEYTSFAFNLSNYMDYDLSNLKDEIANSYLGHITTRMATVLNGKMWLLTSGTYQIDVGYYLPGKTTANSTTRLNIIY